MMGFRIGGFGFFFKEADQILILQTNLFFFKGAIKDRTLLIPIFKWHREKLEGSDFSLFLGEEGRGWGADKKWNALDSLFLLLLKLPCLLVSVKVQETMNR